MGDLCVCLTICIIGQITKLRASRFQRFLNIDTEFITYKPQGVKTKTKQRALVETVLILPRIVALKLLYRKWGHWNTRPRRNVSHHLQRKPVSGVLLQVSEGACHLCAATSGVFLKHFVSMFPLDILPSFCSKRHATEPARQPIK